MAIAEVNSLRVMSQAPEEILFRIKIENSKKFVIAEVPDHYEERPFGTTKRKNGPFVTSQITTLAKHRWRLRRVSR